MPGSKGLSPHELAHRWVKDLLTPTSIYLIYYIGNWENGLVDLSVSGRKNCIIRNKIASGEKVIDFLMLS